MDITSAVAEAYRNGTPTVTTCALLGISRQTYYSHLRKAGITPSRKVFATQVTDEGADIPLVFQITAGIPCPGVSVQFELGGVTVFEPEPEEAAL